MAQVPAEVTNGQMGRYWKGADGNVWVAGSEGTSSAGRWDANTDAYWNNLGYRRQEDPTNPTRDISGGSTSPAPSGSGGGGGGTEYKDTALQRAAALASLGALGTVKNNRFAKENRKYSNLMGEYSDEKGRERIKFDDQTTDNEIALDKGRQASMLAAAQGGRGLRATLAAMGALGGTGVQLADRAITDSANADLGGARDNFDVNAKTLQTSWGDYEDLDRKRRRDAFDIRAENKQAIDAEIMTTRQKLLQDMASYWEQAGNDGRYGNYMAQATRLTPQIAGKSSPTARKYTRQDGNFSPGDLNSYLAGNRDMTVGREAGNTAGPALNNPLYALSQKKEKELA
jgi:hypothetical protein